MMSQAGRVVKILSIANCPPHCIIFTSTTDSFYRYSNTFIAYNSSTELAAAQAVR